MPTTIPSAAPVISRDPATGEVLREFACATAAEVLAAAAAARAEQPAWAARPVRERVAVIRRFQQLLLRRKQEAAELITREAGKPVVESLLTEVFVVLDSAGFTAREAFRFLRPQPLEHANPMMKLKRGWLEREPWGVLGIISPWNYPFSVPATQALQALVCGNAVIVKPSEFTPQAALLLRDLLHEAGVPRDVLQVVIGDGAAGAALLDSGVDKLVFTGSVPTGKRVAQAAAARLLPVVLELGGKDAMVVLDDADVDVASSGAVWGAFVNAGQTCLSVERCYVHRSIYERFAAACAGKAQKLRVGCGMDPETDVGPMIHQRQLEIVERQVNEARDRGARVLCGGTRLPEVGPNFYAPTVMVDVDHAMALMREETFGPVLPIMPFESDDEAVRLANDSEFALSASVWTRDRARGEALARRIQAGAVLVNDAVTCYSIAEAPHGGWKSSGIGRTHGLFGFEECVRVKYIASDHLPRMKKLWWYPYGAAFGAQMDAFTDLMFSPGRRVRHALRSLPALRARKR